MTAHGTEIMDMKRRAWMSSVVAIGVSSLLTPTPQALAADDDETTLHIVGYPKEGLCGEIVTTEKKAFFAKQFGGLKDGGCSVEGYDKSEGSSNGTNDKDKDKTYSIYGKE